MNKNIMYVQIERERYFLEELLKNNYITERDIIVLMNQDDNYGITFSDKEYSKKELYLKKLFRKPYLLCDQEVSDNVKQLLPTFLDRLYNLELNELKFHLDNHEYTKEYFDEVSSILHFKIYESSKDGKSIEKTGKACGVKKKVLCLKG